MSQFLTSVPCFFEHFSVRLEQGHTLNIMKPLSASVIVVSDAHCPFCPLLYFGYSTLRNASQTDSKLYSLSLWQETLESIDSGRWSPSECAKTGEMIRVVQLSRESGVIGRHLRRQTSGVTFNEIEWRSSKLSTKTTTSSDTAAHTHEQYSEARNIVRGVHAVCADS